MRNTPARGGANRRPFTLASAALAMALSALLPACAQLHDTMQDLVHGWETCQPVTPSCFEDQSEFYSMPTIAVLQTWQGHEVAELLAAWGQPTRVEPMGGGNYRYVWSESKTIAGEISYQHDQWSHTSDWDLVRNPDQTFECETYMQVDSAQRVTPLWVNRLGMCSQYFAPRTPAPPRRAAAPAARTATPSAKPGTAATPAAAQPGAPGNPATSPAAAQPGTVATPAAAQPGATETPAAAPAAAQAGTVATPAAQHTPSSVQPSTPAVAAPAVPEEESPVPLDPPRQIREMEGM
ncbi:MAG: hypothetical protein LBT40_00945 [Deltaproteobacteria bacterium]|jgi:hypothetical protein|nr:hypothetical protein [Deltaproteobacteria bacterium]